jgi:hypothetical protein
MAALAIEGVVMDGVVGVVGATSLVIVIASMIFSKVVYSYLRLLGIP